ncbi:MAG: DNA-directed RNA polymerase subunit B [Candidatus Verstraetearchaeota archaeon]|nr:DNA-directed RNA polymerase subunit B [Candidatus Verstraetearchaeota archaeon]
MDDRWVLIESFFKEKGLVRQHLDSFDDFIRNKLQEIVNEQGVIETDLPGYKIKLGKLTIKSPQIHEADGSEKDIPPMEARQRNLTYASSMHLKVTPVEDGYEEEEQEVYVGKLPIMVKSAFCALSKKNKDALVEAGEDPEDPGGYFMVNGSERVVVIQEDLAVNRILVDVMDGASPVTHVAKVFSATSGFRVPVTVERMKGGDLQVTFPSIPGRISLSILMRALGTGSDKELVEFVSSDADIQKALIPTLEAGMEINSVSDALDYIGNRVAIGQTRDFRIQRAEQILDKYLLPHLGISPTDRKKKALFLGQMAEKIIELSLGRRKPDDKDHYANKRLKLAGDLLASLFRVAFKSFCRDMKYQLERAKSRSRRVSIPTLVRADVITERLRHALATGNWVGGKAGVSQLLDRTNYLSTIGHLRRIISPLSRSQPHFEARDLHSTQWGRLCPSETPEGPNCGLVKNLALMAFISVGVDERPVEELLYELETEPIESARKKGLLGTKVILNGRLIGIHQKPELLVTEMRKLKRRGRLNHEVNVAHYSYGAINEVYVNCDAGRVRRPLIIVDGGSPSLTRAHVEKLVAGEWTWNDLVLQGIVEYLDAEEEENAYIALDMKDLNKDRTHMEIVPSTILGISASMIPFLEANQSPRNTYGSAMVKQSLGFYAANFSKRLDTRGHLLHYPHSPLVNTRSAKILDLDRRPAGQNFVVAILSHSGFNIEDALIMNKSSVERGLARSSFFRCYETEERRYPGGQEDKIEAPSPNVRGYRTPESYKFLGDDGIIEPESIVQGGDVLIGKTSPPRFLEEYREFESTGPVRRETSVSMRAGEDGVVDLVLVTETSDGNKLVKIRVRNERIPELGDKFASRHGQKGVVGMLVPQCDMPYTEDGVVPDLIINPHAIPSRMTLGQLLEVLGGKAYAVSGQPQDGTAFVGSDEKTMRFLLKKACFKSTGKEVMYDGRTGRILEAEVFIGVAYYLKLHHMVADKMHARARGPVQILTRQPTEGRAREGGLRFGEMERDCLIGHGAAMLLKERLLDESDRTVVNICEDCGLISYYDRVKDKYVCPICGDKAKTTRVVMSYAFKLLLQELMSLGIAPRLKLSERV